MSLRGLLLDTRPLRESPRFRAWWLGSALSSFGGQLTSFALLYYLWTSTHEPALVGGVALVQLVATVLGALLGGSLADRTDRRVLVMRSRVAQLAGSVTLAVLVYTGAAPVAWSTSSPDSRPGSAPSGLPPTARSPRGCCRPRGSAPGSPCRGSATRSACSVGRWSPGW